jgi:hypothetical protein
VGDPRDKEVEPMRRWRKLTPGTALAISLSLLMVLAPASAGANPAFEAGSDAIRAVVVRSFGRCQDPGGGWTDIDDNWQNYGSVPVTVDFSDPTLCNTTITYDALVASGADVMILSDPCGAPVTYSQHEVDAIRRYARDGHNVLGTYLLFGGGTCSHPRMAQLFGYRPLPGQVIVGSMDDPYHEFVPDSPLFRNLPNPFQSEGYPFTQLPNDRTWSRNELAGAVYLAKTGSVEEGVISIYTTPQYSAIYSSNMPEYFGGPDDSQFLYNAIIYPSTG